jgi:hypothetical protein
LTETQIERALELSRSDEKTRRVFHEPYVMDTHHPTVARVEVITELRRLVLLAEEHVARGDLLFTRGTREASDALRPWKDKVSIATTIRFDPRNAYVLAPPVDISLLTPSGEVPRLDQRSRSLFGTGDAGGRLPVVGAEADADFSANMIARVAATMVVRAEGKDIARIPVDFSRLP